MKEEKNYFVYIPAESYARPVRCAALVVRQINTLCQSLSVPYCLKHRLCLHCVTSSMSDASMNSAATYLLNTNGKTVKGDAVLCKFNDDYEFFTKSEAKAMCGILNNIR